ncbi:MAG: CDP-glycerol glycerophosphotransferase family protein [Ruminococcaceae bacterium]|nr:CDP-glycerol glycerophosphotransferase family protein [Oscillospiraceae bacterium]
MAQQQIKKKKKKKRNRDTFIGRCKIRIVRFLMGKILPRYYDHYAKKPVDEDKVIFVESRYEKLSNNFELIYDRLSKDDSLNIKIHLLRHLFVGRLEHFRRCFALAKDAATAKYIFICEGCRVTGKLNIRPETTVFQVWHGCGLGKRFGFSCVNKEFGGNLEERRFSNIYKADYASVSAPSIIPYFEEAFGKGENNPIEVLALGMSRTDIYFDKERIAKAYDNLYAAVPEARGKKVICYSPTFRGNPSEASVPDLPDYCAMADRFRDDYVLIVKYHPMIQSVPAIPDYCKGFAFDVSKTLSSDDAVMSSDIYINDYSSLMYDCSLMNRPQLFYAPDVDDYEDERGMYFDYETSVPSKVLKTTDELIEAIENIDNYDFDRLAEFREKYMSSCDGHSTDRIIAKMFGDRVIKGS